VNVYAIGATKLLPNYSLTKEYQCFL